MDESQKQTAAELGQESKLTCLAKGYCECLLIFFTVIIFLARVFTFTSHAPSLVNLEQFPSECSEWATLGCTRIALKAEGKEEGCLRPIDIPSEWPIIFQSKDGITEQIKDCASRLGGSKEYFSNDNFEHYTVQTAIFGFIDDMYISFTPNGQNQIVVYS